MTMKKVLEYGNYIVLLIAILGAGVWIGNLNSKVNHLEEDLKEMSERIEKIVNTSPLQNIQTTNESSSTNISSGINLLPAGWIPQGPGIYGGGYYDEERERFELPVNLSRSSS